MRMYRFSSLAVALAAALTLACDTARNVENNTGGNCTGCHGGLENQTGAPPYDRNHQASSPAVGAHTQHIDAGVACESCHVVPHNVSDPGHIEGKPARVNFSGLAVTGGAQPAYASDTKTCSSTYCHGAKVQGGTLKNPNWGTDIGKVTCGSCHGYPPVGVGPHTASTEGANCHVCHPDTVNADQSLKAGGKHLNGTIDTVLVAGQFHPAGWATPVNGLTPHGLAANYHDAQYANGLTDCRTCHGPALDGGVVGVSCNECHGGWQSSCTFCHGDAKRATNQPAPPIDTQGHSQPTDRGVGAHQTHLNGKTISDGVACTECHTVPTDIAHVNGTTQVSLRGSATVAGTFNAQTASCATVYCHGNFQNGKATTTAGNAPAWTQTSGQDACGTCHSAQQGTDASWGHKVAQHQQIVCAACHVAGYDTPTTVNKAEHVNGSLNITGAVTNFSYSTTAHTCTSVCHGPAGHVWTQVP